MVRIWWQHASVHDRSDEQVIDWSVKCPRPSLMAYQVTADYWTCGNLTHLLWRRARPARLFLRSRNVAYTT